MTATTMAEVVPRERKSPPASLGVDLEITHGPLLLLAVCPGSAHGIDQLLGSVAAYSSYTLATVANHSVESFGVAVSVHVATVGPRRAMCNIRYSTCTHVSSLEASFRVSLSSLSREFWVRVGSTPTHAQVCRAARCVRLALRHERAREGSARR